MPKHYVTFGQVHTHRINGITVDCDCVVEYEAENAIEGRKKAFEYFGDKFFTDYHDNAFDMESLKYFPRGIVNIEPNINQQQEILGKNYDHNCKICQGPMTEDEFNYGMGECKTCFPIN